MNFKSQYSFIDTTYNVASGGPIKMRSNCTSNFIYIPCRGAISYSAPRISFAPSARKHILHVNEAYANQTEFGLVGAFVKYTT